MICLVLLAFCVWVAWIIRYFRKMKYHAQHSGRDGYHSTAEEDFEERHQEENGFVL